MTKVPERHDHPKAAYLIGTVVVFIMISVLGGVFNHLAFSHHGPGLLRPLVEKIDEQNESAILKEAKKHEEYEAHRHFHNVFECPSEPDAVRPQTRQERWRVIRLGPV